MENISQEKTVQAEEPKQKSPITALLIGVTTFLFLTLVAVLLFLFTGLGSMFVSRVENPEVIEVEEQLEENDKEVVALENEGWALYSIPEYRFSVEIPSYAMMQELGVEEKDVYSYWSIKQSEDPFVEHFDLHWYSDINGDLLRVVQLSFYPFSIPESVACGQGCVREHSITVYIFDDSKTFSEIKELYIKELTEVNDSEMTGAEFEETEKWGYDTLHFTEISPGGEVSGYVLNTGERTYHLSYFLSETPEESLEVAQKVLGSMKFE